MFKCLRQWLYTSIYNVSQVFSFMPVFSRVSTFCLLSLLVVTPPCLPLVVGPGCRFDSGRGRGFILYGWGEKTWLRRRWVMAENAKSGKSEKNEPFSLSAKQERAIVAVLQSRSVEEACRNARVSKTLYYRWLRGGARFWRRPQESPRRGRQGGPCPSQ